MSEAYAARQPEHAPVDISVPEVLGGRPRLPADDPFHQPPVGFESMPLGSVLRAREVRVAFFGLVPQRVRATQLLFRTSGADGEPMAAVTTVLTPTGSAAQPGSRPVVSYQCAIDAITSRCFPSYALLRGAVAFGALAQVEYLVIASLLARGWAVAIPDHEGPQGLWGMPRMPGYITLDGLRAAVAHDGLAVHADDPIALWGYSGGGLASAWAAELWAHYAPELNVVGAVLGSPVGDLGNTYSRLNGGLFSGLPAMVVSALSQVYPDLQRVLAEHATARGRARLQRLSRMTTVEAVLRFLFSDMGRMLDRPLTEILALPEVRAVFEAIRLGRSIPQMPVLVIQSATDLIMSAGDIDDLVQTYRDGGADVTYHREPLGEHILLHPISTPLALRWLSDRFRGRSTDADRRGSGPAWPTVLTPTGARGLLTLAGVAVRVATGRTLSSH
ncbi:lipase family protein [Williamsia sp. CHRR-6]|uniref:lipase family protein n=1 Tax=Williamsia sp. CHRR-6 TaxID=2835871 RepID=UPI001BD94CFA|nr:lipase family protein [Williamsia sp. CHRR-6]MBT0567242.1 lipase [Williamsia sp. CHRR-6]